MLPGAGRVVVGAPRLVSGAPGCSQTYPNNSNGNLHVAFSFHNQLGALSWDTESSVRTNKRGMTAEHWFSYVGDEL